MIGKAGKTCVSVSPINNRVIFTNRSRQSFVVCILIFLIGFDGGDRGSVSFFDKTD